MKTVVALLAAGLSMVAFAQQPAQQSPGAQPRQSAPAPQAAQPAQPGAQAAQPTFETADKNQDGKLSKEEAGAVKGLDFAAADANKDSALDRQEYMAAIAKGSSPRG